MFEDNVNAAIGNFSDAQLNQIVLNYLGSQASSSNIGCARLSQGSRCLNDLERKRFRRIVHREFVFAYPL